MYCVHCDVLKVDFVKHCGPDAECISSLTLIVIPELPRSVDDLLLLLLVLMMYFAAICLLVCLLWHFSYQSTLRKPY